MKKFCTSLREHAKNIIDFEKNGTTNKRKVKLYQDAKVRYICEKRILKFIKDKNYQKVRDHCHYTGKYRDAAHSICNLKFNVPNEIPVAFHNGPTHDYYFIIKELASKFKEQSKCLGENTQKYKKFSAPIGKRCKN